VVNEADPIAHQGDVTGQVANTVVVKVQGVDVATNELSNGQAWVYATGTTSMVATDIATQTGLDALASTQALQQTQIDSNLTAITANDTDILNLASTQAVQRLQIDSNVAAIASLSLQDVVDNGATATNVLTLNGVKLGSSTVSAWGTTGTGTDGTTYSNGLAVTLGGSATSTNVLTDLIVGNPASLGSELVSNGTFTGSANFWELGGTAVYQSTGTYANAIRIPANTTGTLTPSNSIGITTGQVYKLVYKITSFGDSVPVSASLGGMSKTNSFAATTTKTILMGSYNTNSLNLSVTALANYDVYMDDVSVKQVTDGDAWIADELHVGTAISLNGERITAWEEVSIVGTVTNVAAGTNIVITGTASKPVVSTDGSLQTAIDLNSATGASHTASIAANSASILAVTNGLQAQITANDTDISNLATTQQTVKATADSAMQDLVDDTTPTLGGNLDANGKQMNAASRISCTGQTLSLSFLGSTGGSGYLFQSNNDADVGTEANAARTVHSHTNMFKGHSGSSNIFVKSNIFGVTNAISFTIDTNIYSILFD